ncbi:MAG: hypothetical protein ACYCQJ_01070 [Nitrososphaerales archaeon]
MESKSSDVTQENFVGAILFAMRSKSGEYDIQHILLTSSKFLSVDAKKLSKLRVVSGIANLFADGLSGIGSIVAMRSWKKNKPANMSEILVNDQSSIPGEVQALKQSMEEAIKDADIEIKYDEIKSVEVKNTWGMGTQILIKTGGMFSTKTWAVYPSVEETKKFLSSTPLASKLK